MRSTVRDVSTSEIPACASVVPGDVKAFTESKSMELNKIGAEAPSLDFEVLTTSRMMATMRAAMLSTEVQENALSTIHPKHTTPITLEVIS